jgi:glutathione S-transferase
MLVIHHLGVSQSDRIVWLCEELGLPYELRRYDRDPTGSAPPEYKALHPFGTAPVIEDDGLVLGESAAIIEYLCRTRDGGRLFLGPDDPEFSNFLFWFHFANGSALPAGLIELVLARFGGESAAAENRPVGRSRMDKMFAMAEARLGEVPFFAGAALSAADIMMLFSLTTMRRFVPRDIAPYPNIKAYLQRIGARPALQRAMAKADPDLPLLVD